MTAHASARGRLRGAGTRGVAAVMRASGASRVLESALGVALGTATLVNRTVATAYRVAWPRLGLRYWDHRYSALGGVNGWHWAERGVVARRLIRPGSAVLDICTGDGMYAAEFMATQAKRVDAIDRDERAIDTARKRHVRGNLRFFAQDALHAAFPAERYDTVCCFASLQYFTQDEAAAVLRKITASLEPGGVFVGSLPVYAVDASPDPHARRVFTSDTEIRAMLAPHFGEVHTWSSDWGVRTEWYFECRVP